MDQSLVTRQGVDAAHEIPDNVSCLRPAVEGSNPPKRLLSCAYKAPRRSLLCWSIFFLASSLCALRFSFAIYSFPYVDKRPDFDSFHMLSTDRPQARFENYVSNQARTQYGHGPVPSFFGGSRNK